ncbi:hypothetical protein RF11_11342 [Thelohanellus kitauei]|uniref:Uncharacterized protein n=1 Tax=Thelohanellus kitauei TaxID=669202 RepID=A0A0C2MBU0_THEKT|nr:hypothetical protein RF11_11342 [Thelohanellus kitauei]
MASLKKNFILRERGYVLSVDIEMKVTIYHSTKILIMSENDIKFNETKIFEDELVVELKVGRDYLHVTLYYDLIPTHVVVTNIDFTTEVDRENGHMKHLQGFDFQIQKEPHIFKDQKLELTEGNTQDATRI